MRAGYIRVSTEEQQTHGISIEAQTKRLVAAGVPVEAITVETGSASKAKVPQLLALLERAKAGDVTEIVCLRQDRLQRSHEIDALVWGLIKSQRCTITFLDQGGSVDPDDPVSCANTEIVGVFARFEAAMISRRVKDALEVNRSQLKHHGPAPYGYITRQGKLKPDPKTWDICRQVIETYIRTGSSTEARRVRYQLSDPKTRKPWSVSAFARWVKSPVLRGAIVYGMRTKEPEIHWAQHERLISSAEWVAIAAIRRENLVNGGARRCQRGPHLATGIVKCSHCGGPAHVRAIKGRKTLLQCNAVRGAGCEMGHRNHVFADDVDLWMRWALIQAAAVIAERSTPHELPEPPELTGMRDELVALERMKSPAAKAAVTALRLDVLQMERALHSDAQRRENAVREEMQRLRRDGALDMHKDELRSLCVRYGLTIMIKNCKPVSYRFDGLAFERDFTEADVDMRDVFPADVVQALDGVSKERFLQVLKKENSCS